MPQGAVCRVCGKAIEGSACLHCGAARDQAASDRDQVGADRDEAASRRDQLAADADLESGGDATVHDLGVLAREESVRDRARSTAGRAKSAEDRRAAAGERAAVQRLLDTLESMSDAFVTLDSEWRFTYLNPQTEAIVDRRREDLLGKNIWDEFPEAVGSGFDEAYRRALREQVAVRYEGRYEPLGRTIEIRAYPVSGGLAIYFSDVTADRLRDAQQRQTQRLETLGQVAAGVAHDFGNLLAAIAGFAELGQAERADERKAGYYFDEIDAASRKAVALTRQLLTFSREGTHSPVSVDLNEIVEGLSSLLRQLLPPAIELRLALSPRPVAVFADRSQLEQVLINLVVNSRDAISEAGSITVSTTNGDPEAVVHDIRVPSGWLQVADTGSGIPEDVLPRIFDPYFSTKPPELGTGLGLAMIYGIVSQNGGAIFVESTVGVGTTMTVALPRGTDGEAVSRPSQAER